MNNDKHITDRDLKDLLSRKLNLLRKKSGKTLEETCAFLNLDYTQYHKLCHGVHFPHILTLLNINKAYGLDMNWWFSELDNLPSKREEKIKNNVNEANIINNYRKLDSKTKNVIVNLLKNLVKEQK
jgi:transcriptional regulator with XRE-family HTH domain